MRAFRITQIGPAQIGLAGRNLFRHKKRSLINLTAITFGLGAMIFLRGFVYGAQNQMVENITTTLTGDAQIVPASLENIFNTNGVIEASEGIRQMLGSDPRVANFAERILGGGLVTSNTTSMATFVVGFDPEQEDAIGSRRSVVRGRLMSNQDLTGAALGEKMRAILGLEIGDEVVVTAQDYYGSLAGGKYTLIGTFETGNDQIDNGTVMLLKPTAQKLLSYGEMISKIALKVDRRFSIDDVVQDLRRGLGQKDLHGSELKVLTWAELLPMLSQMIRFQNGMIFIIMVIVLTVVAAGILNTLMMSVIERIREFGLMLALGTTPLQIIQMVVLESFLLTMAGALLGSLLGISLVLYFGRVGIDMSRFVSALSNFLIGTEVHPRIDWFYLLVILLLVMTTNLLASFYPAWRAGRLLPIEAMRHTG